MRKVQTQRKVQKVQTQRKVRKVQLKCQNKTAQTFLVLRMAQIEDPVIQLEVINFITLTRRNKCHQNKSQFAPDWLKVT